MYKVLVAMLAVCEDDQEPREFDLGEVEVTVCPGEWTDQQCVAAACHQYNASLEEGQEENRLTVEEWLDAFSYYTEERAGADHKIFPEILADLREKGVIAA